MPLDGKVQFDRRIGASNPGTVGIRAFDEGIIETLGGALMDFDLPDPRTGKLTKAEDNTSQKGYFVKVEGIPSAEPFGSLGIPISWSFSEDLFVKYRLSGIVVKRDDISPAMQRWHPGTRPYRVPAPGAVPVTLPASLGFSGASGFNRYMDAPMGVPFDITYTIQIMSHYRAQAIKLLEFVLKVYQPYSSVLVKDSLGDLRSYECFMEGTGMLDDVMEVSDRLIGFTVSLRVEAELDLNDPTEYAALTSLPGFSVTSFTVGTTKL